MWEKLSFRKGLVNQPTPKDVSKLTKQPSNSSYNTSENVAVTAGWSGIIPSQRLREDTLIRVSWPFFFWRGYIYIEIPNVSPEKSMNLQYVSGTHRTLPGLKTSHKDGTQQLASSLSVLSLLWVSVIDLESPVVESGCFHKHLPVDLNFCSEKTPGVKMLRLCYMIKSTLKIARCCPR